MKRSYHNSVTAQMLPTASQKSLWDSAWRPEHALREDEGKLPDREEKPWRRQIKERSLLHGWLSEQQPREQNSSFICPHTASLHSWSPDRSHKQAKARAGPSPAEYKELWSRFRSVLVLFRSKLLCYLTVRPFAGTQTPADRNRNRNRNSEDASGIFVLFCGEKTKRKQYFTVMDYFYEKLTNCKTNEWNAKLTC